MTANYQSIRERTTRVVDAVMAETVKLYPLSMGRVDGAREQVEFQAVLRTGSVENTSLSGGMARDWVSRISAGKAQLHIDRVSNPSIVVNVGDKIEAVSRPDEPMFEILAIDDRGHSRLVLELGQTS